MTEAFNTVKTFFNSINLYNNFAGQKPNHRSKKWRLKPLFVLTFGIVAACSPTQNETSKIDTIGEVKVWDEALSEIISTDAVIEFLAAGFQWSEGPAWDKKRQRLYFSDVPQNKAYVWSESEGLKTFLDPSGIPNDEAEGFREPGSNGLLMTPDGSLLIANHGKRAVEKMDIDSKTRKTVINTYRGLSLNSPNDMALAKDGSLFFTDPAYGLKGIDESPLKQLSFSGVYKLSLDGELSVIDDTQAFPNGIALSPDERTLYVAVSDSEKPKIVKYAKNDAGKFGDPQLWFDAKPFQNQGLPGLPDGMVVADSGHVFATGPGGVFILSPDGKALGQINTGRASANCTFGDDGKTLYITAGDILLRVKLLQGKRI